MSKVSPPHISLTEIWIYPIKSLGGIRLRTSRVHEKGLLYDRRWMLVDEQGNFMTQRLNSTMALFSVQLNSNHLEVQYKKNSIDIPMDQQGRPMTARIWEDEVEVVEVSDRHNDWFADRLGVPCKLVAFPEVNTRPVNQAYQINHEQVSLADAYPFLILGEESLTDLNRRLDIPVPMNRFRPNLVFKGGVPYEEDTWKRFRIGQNEFAAVKPCSRCVTTTIDQQTAEKGIEPLATLATYRRKEGKVYFGQNVIAIDHGEISEGDEIVLG